MTMIDFTVFEYSIAPFITARECARYLLISVATWTHGRRPHLIRFRRLVDMMRRMMQICRDNAFWGEPKTFTHKVCKWYPVHSRYYDYDGIAIANYGMDVYFHYINRIQLIGVDRKNLLHCELYHGARVIIRSTQLDNNDFIVWRRDQQQFRHVQRLWFPNYAMNGITLSVVTRELVNQKIRVHFARQLEELVWKDIELPWCQPVLSIKKLTFTKAGKMLFE